MAGSTGGNLSKNQNSMKKLDFKQKKYVLPLLALPFLLLFVYVGAQFTKEDTSKKDQPKELSLSLGETQDSIMTKNDAYDAFFKKDDNRTMLEGLDKEEDSLYNYDDQLSLAQKRKIDSLKAVSSNCFFAMFFGSLLPNSSTFPDA